ncbi:hypothetical protein EDD22DRAFT_1051400 [Suillus occidentalis]|nr:hypothetical protein EDD22DRAFT_1051400 [Suillus occidentalis]
MEYSSDDIAAAKRLQIATYLYGAHCLNHLFFVLHSPVSTATFWTYDYWTFLLRSHWSKVKGMYIVTRYLPFIFLIMDLYLTFTLNENPDKCRVWGNIDTGLGIASATFSECFFVLRTYALWNNNKFVLAVILSTFFIQLTRSSQGATRARAVSCSSYPFFSFPCFNLSWRDHPSRLYVVLVNHNTFYYVWGFLFSVTNIFTSLLLQVYESPKSLMIDLLMFRDSVLLCRYVALFPVHDSCNPRHTIAPPSLADEPVCI